jgi:zinc D-Ala-D-Ala carboxypeptidase
MKWYTWALWTALIIIILAIVNRTRVMKNLEKIVLGKNFNLAEFVTTGTGIENIPGPEEIENLRALVENVLQPLRDAIGKPIHITSGFRSMAVNAAIGGAGTSQHVKGQAADFHIDGMTSDQVIAKIRAMKLPFDQVIDEIKGTSKWVHVSHNSTGAQRYQWLTFRDGTYTTIKTGLA